VEGLQWLVQWLVRLLVHLKACSSLLTTAQPMV
jgi:hypothetical protein